MATKAGALLAGHIEDLQARRWSASAQEQGQRVGSMFLSHLRRKRITDLRSVRQDHILGFLRSLDHLMASSQRTYLSAVRRFFAYLVKRHQVFQDPTDAVRLPRVLTLPRLVLSESEVARLVETPFRGSVHGTRNRAILELLYGTGVRLSECCRIDLTDVDLGQGLLLVRNGKGRKDRVVPMAGRAVFMLDNYLREARPELVQSPRENALFLNHFGNRLGKTMVDTVVHQSAKKAGIKAAVSPHILRHSFATHLLRRGANIREVQELLGHKSLQSTEVYTRVSITDLKAVLDRAHPMARTYNRPRSWKQKKES